MMLSKRFLLSLVVTFLLSMLFAFSKSSMMDSTEIKLTPYGSLRGHLAAYDHQVELQENASRIGLNVEIQKSKIKFLAGIELQINMFKGGSSFNADGNISSGFLTIKPEQKRQVFGNRLGYLGLDLNEYGRLTFGKQWSVYYDVTSYTSGFNVFGGKASATYIEGTDGGENGTGRADQSLIYRNNWGPVAIGLQLQARGSHNGNWMDGYGFSTQLTPFKGWEIAGSYIKTLLSKSIIEDGGVLGLHGQPEYISAGIKHRSDRLLVALVWANQQNGDLVQQYRTGAHAEPTTQTLVFDAKGLELFGQYKLKEYSLLAGYNQYVPSSSKEIRTASGEHNKNLFFKKQFIFGATYNPVNFVQIYGEYRLSKGYNSLGNRDADVLAVGLKIELRKTYSSSLNF